MLTSDLLRVRRRDGQLIPRYLKGKPRARLLPMAAALAEVVEQVCGRRRSDVMEALDEIPFAPRDRIVVMGLRKLLLDRCEFNPPEGVEAQVVRECTFRLAAQARQNLELQQPFDRAAVIEAAAAELQLDASQVEAFLFSDLKRNEVLTSFRPLAANELIDRYNLALPQGILLRATRVCIELDESDPGQVRHLFRAARFHGLLHRVYERENGYRIELDGPYSLFSAVQKYGIKLALFLPALLHGKRWRLQADVLWGKKREPCQFTLDPSAKLRTRQRPIQGVAQELDVFVERFQKLKSAWTMEPNQQIFALPGAAVCIPDFVFSNGETGEVVYLEVFGFWSRTAVFQRIETVRQAFPARLILAVSKHLRVSEELLSEEDAGELYIYAGSMRPRALLSRLDGEV